MLNDSDQQFEEVGQETPGEGWRERATRLSGKQGAAAMEPQFLSLLQSLCVLSDDYASQESISVQFLGPEGGEGTSGLTEMFASFAAERLGGPVCLISFDAANGIAVNRYGRSWGRSSLSEQFEREFPEARLARDEAAATLVDYHATTEDEDADEEGTAELVLRRPRTEIAETTDALARRLTTRIEREQSRVALLIVNSRPLSQSLESLLVSRKVDGVVLVLDADRTKARAAEAARDRIAAAGGRVLGVVLNKQRRYTPGWLASLFPEHEEAAPRGPASRTRRGLQAAGAALVAMILMLAGYDMVMNLGGPERFGEAISRQIERWTAPAPERAPGTSAIARPTGALAAEAPEPAQEQTQEPQARSVAAQPEAAPLPAPDPSAPLPALKPEIEP